MRVCIPIAPGDTIGGPSSFKRKFEKGLKQHGIGVVYDLAAEPYDLVLVVGCTRQVRALRRCKRRGIPIVQRLDGFNWYYRRQGFTWYNRRWGLSWLNHRWGFTAAEWWRDSFRNFLMRYTRDHLADHVVYQSKFVRDWWHSDSGPAPVPDSIVYNGVDTDEFTPEGESLPRSEGITLLSVEGGLGAHQRVLQTPIDTWRQLSSTRAQTRLLLVGHVQQQLLGLIPTDERVEYLGIISNAQMPYYLRSASAFISAEINPACSNSVVEALACGTPVVGFATGALPELVEESAGICVDYGADPWKLERPDIDSLARAAETVALDYQRYSAGARRSALERFGLKKMVAEYLAVFERVMGDKVAALKAEHA